MANVFTPNNRTVEIKKNHLSRYWFLHFHSFCLSADAGKTKILFVKNLSYDTTAESLGDAFEGSTSARIGTHADTGRARG